MSILLGSAYGKVGLDASGLRNSIKQAKSDLSSFASAARQMGKTLNDVGNKLTVGLTLPLAAIGTQAVKMAITFEDTLNKAQVVFGEFADSVVDNSKKAAKALGLSEEAYLDYASSIGAALKAGGMSLEEATKLSEQAVKNIADLVSFHGGQISEAAAAWQSAIRGQFEPIQKYFPFITQQYLITYGVANGLIDANTQQLTANQRAIVLNAIALNEQLNPALNDFAETADSTANMARSLGAEYENLAKDLGTKLLPLVKQGATVLSDLLDKFNNLSPGAQDAIVKLGGLLFILGPTTKAAGGLVQAFGFLSKMFLKLGGGGLLTGLSGELFGMSSILSGSLGPAAVGAGGAIATFGGILLAALPAIALFFIAWKTNLFGFRDSVQQLWWLLKYGFGKMSDSIKITLGQLGWIITWTFKKAWADVKAETTGALADWGNSIKSTWEKLVGFFNKLKQDIVAFFHQDWSQFGKYIIMGIVNGIFGAMPWLAQAVSYIANTILGGLAKGLKAHSPSEEGVYYGEMTDKGVVKGLQKGLPELKAAAKQAASTVTSQFYAAQAAFRRYLTQNGYNGKSQFVAPTKLNMQAAFKDFLQASGASGKRQFALPTSSNMQAAFKQFALAQAAVRPAATDPFLEKSRPVRNEIAMNFQSGLTVREAHDIYSEKLKDTFDFLEKRLGSV